MAVGTRILSEVDAGASIAATPSRLPFIDNLRWTMILLVLSMHAADTYSPLGDWYYTDRQPLSVPAVLALAAWQMYLQAFFMGLLFLIAGYFVPGSYDRRGALSFLRERAFRLGLPVLLYMFAIGPVTEYFCAHSWTSTEPTSFASEWLKHVRNGQFLQENGPLWFCLALLIFSVAYTGYMRLRGPRPDWPAASAPPNTRQLLALAVTMALMTFLVRLLLPAGMAFLNMHLGDFPQYVLLFATGIVAARRQWLLRLDESKAKQWLAIVLPIGFVVWLGLVLGGGALSGNAAAYAGGWHWQAACLNLWESFTCVALCYGLLAIFRSRFNSQGPMARFLSANAFSVYVFHPPIIILLARWLHDLAMPALVKVAVLTGLSAIVSFGLSHTVFRRIPLLRKIL